MDDILRRRNAGLFSRIHESASISRVDAEQIVASLSEEFTDSLDEEWEPTDYGRIVNGLLNKVNRARIEEWPS